LVYVHLSIEFYRFDSPPERESAKERERERERDRREREERGR
jgi:hypothetical protein